MNEIMMPFFSVVIPLYNKEKSVGRAISSVLNQSFQDFEILIVNDGSTDKSLDRVKNIHDPRIKIIDKKNEGVSIARNTGVYNSNAEYIAFLDADDEWLPDFLLRIRGLISLNADLALYCARYREVMDDGSLFLGNCSYKENALLVLDDFFYTYATCRSLVHSSSVCVNKKHFTSIGGFPAGVKWGEDIYVWLRLACITNVGFANYISATVHRESENRTITRIKTDVLFHVYYFCSDMSVDVWDRLSLAKRKQLQFFLKRNILVNALFCLKIRDYISYRKYLLFVKSISFKYWLVMFLGQYLLSPSMLNGLRKIRNKWQNEMVNK